jgi:hypothetical protein
MSRFLPNGCLLPDPDGGLLGSTPVAFIGSAGTLREGHIGQE